MEKKKITIALVIAIVSVGAFLVFPGALAEEELVDAYNKEAGSHRRRGPIKRLMVLVYILRNGVPTVLEGEVVAIEGRILVIGGDEGLISVNLPWRWIVDGETYKLHDLFDGDPWGPGDDVSISSLKLEMAKETYTATAYFAYELEVGGAEASAVLPFNIED